MIDLKRYIDTRAEIINTALSRDVFRHSGTMAHPARLREAMAYSLMAGGKRIRPILCIAAAEAVDETGTIGKPGDTAKRSKQLLTVACSLEVLHTYSLIHDDLPAMDDDELRRGKPTCHIAFDEATAILAGDGLLTLAFELLSGIDPEEDGDAETLLQIIQMFSRAAGYQGMVEGQMRDILSENAQLSPSALKAMHTLKTGALIQAAVRAGAIIGNANGRQIKQLTAYSEYVGLAFQVADDILNVEGDARVMGKAIGTDRHREKNTYPSLLGLEASKKLARDLVNDALKVLTDFDSRSDPLRAIASYIIERRK